MHSVLSSILKGCRRWFVRSYRAIFKFTAKVSSQRSIISVLVIQVSPKTAIYETKLRTIPSIKLKARWHSPIVHIFDLKVLEWMEQYKLVGHTIPSPSSFFFMGLKSRMAIMAFGHCRNPPPTWVGWAFSHLPLNLRSWTIASVKPHNWGFCSQMSDHLEQKTALPFLRSSRRVPRPDRLWIIKAIPFHP